MSGASPSPGVSSTAPPGGAFHRVREFWERISEGRQLDDLWLQFAADARAGYGKLQPQVVKLAPFADALPEFAHAMERAPGRGCGRYTRTWRGAAHGNNRTESRL